MTRYLLLLIAILFLVSRLFKVTEIPISMYWDEASIGYNAYSILTTGRDEWGTFLPINFRAFGEFKLPVYIYSVTLIQLIFGMNDLSVRLPAVIYSFLSLVLVYLLGVKIYQRRDVGLWAALSLTVVPWFFIFSRTGYEATAGLFWFLLGLYCWLRSPKIGWVIIAGVSFILSMYSYNSFRLVTPLMLGYLIYLVWFTQKIATRKYLLWYGLAGLLFLFSLVPIYKLVFLEPSVSRFQTISIFSQTKDPLALISQFLQNYLSHFSWQFLMTTGDGNLRSHIGGFGQLYWFQLPLLIFGLIRTLQRRRLIELLPVFGLIISPIPAALTRESPHALRSISAVPFIAILIGVGIVWLIEIFSKLIKNRSLVPGINVIIVGLSIVFFGSYLTRFLTIYPELSANAWQKPYRQIFIDHQVEIMNASQVYISDELGQPYIFGLYYLKILPSDFQSTVMFNPPSDWGHSTVSGFGKFKFTKDLPQDVPGDDILVFDPVVKTSDN